jgi:hypothetical protein
MINVGRLQDSIIKEIARFIVKESAIAWRL